MSVISKVVFSFIKALGDRSKEEHLTANDLSLEEEVLNLSFNLKMLSLILFIVVSIISCKTVVRSSDKGQGGIRIDQVREADGEFPTLTITDTGKDGFLVRVCEEATKTCSPDTTIEPIYDLRSLPEGRYTAEVFGCDQVNPEGQCSRWIGNAQFSHGAFPSENVEFYLSFEQDLRDRRKFVSYAIYGLLSDFKSNLDQCAQDAGLSASDLEGSFYGDVFTLLGNFTAQGPIVGVNALAENYADSGVPTTLNELRSNLQEGLGLAGFEYSSKQNVKVTFMSYITPPPKHLKIFKKATWKVDKKAILDYFSGERRGHAALKIERLNPDTGKFELYRYVSYPSGDDLRSDLEVTAAGYLSRRRHSIELPPLGEEDLIRFETWYRGSEYAALPVAGKPAELATKRLEQKKAIGTAMKLDEKVSKKVLNDPEFRNLVKKAVSRQFEIEDLAKQLAEIGEEPESAAKQTKLGKIEKRQQALLNTQKTWFKDWTAFTNLAQSLKTDELTTQLNEYLKTEVESEKYRRPLAPDEESKLLGQLHQSENYLKRVLLLPPEVELETFRDFKNPWYLASPGEIMKRYHKVDPDKLEEWLEFAEKNLRTLETNYDYITGQTQWQWGLDIKEAMLKDPLAVWHVVADWGRYKKDITPKFYEDYHKTLFELYSRGPIRGEAYKKLYSEKWNNCSNAVGRSLDILYQKPGYFTVKRPIVNPGSVEERARSFVHDYETLKAQQAATPQSSTRQMLIGFAAVAALSATATMVTTSSIQSLGLAGEDTFAKCFTREQELFWELSETPFNHMQSYNFLERSMNHFMVTKPPTAEE